MQQEDSCLCRPAPTLIFACSGAADTGEIADRAARRLHAERAGVMYCLAGIGGRVSGIVKSTEAAARVLAIDGCQLDCARRTLELAGMTGFGHLRVTDLGLIKGKTDITPERIQQVVDSARAVLNDEQKEGPR
jgi:uncharacterized metal-binding protein